MSFKIPQFSKIPRFLRKKLILRLGLEEFAVAVAVAVVAVVVEETTRQ
jgi:hypothetical protein